jgi:hypothetical protein
MAVCPKGRLMMTLVLGFVVTAVLSSTPDDWALDYRTLLRRGEFVDVFARQFRLVMEEYWSEDGDWKADMMNDATGYGPRLLFKMYAASGDERLYHRAITTCRYQEKLLAEVLGGKTKFSVGTVGGVFCFLDGIEHAKTEEERKRYRDAMRSLLSMAGSALLWNAGQSLMPDLKQVRSYGTPILATLVFEYAALAGEKEFLLMAKKLLETHEEEFFDAETGLFKGRHGWNQPAAFFALAKAYAVTREPVYLEKATKLMASLQKVNPVFTGVFFDRSALERQQHWSIAFSTILFYMKGFLDLYAATGDETYRACAKHGIQFSIDELLLSRAYPEGYEDRWWDGEKRIIPFFSHDIRVGDGARRVAPSYCLGCIFLALDHVWDMNTLRAK